MHPTPLVPPTPGPIAAAGNLGLEDSLGLVIMFGVVISIFTMLAGFFWAKYIGGKIKIQEDLDNEVAWEKGLDLEEKVIEEQYGKLPSTFQAFAPILIPILPDCSRNHRFLPRRPDGNRIYSQPVQVLR